MHRESCVFAPTSRTFRTMSTQLTRLESVDNDPYIGGVAIVFDSGVAKQIAWRVTPGRLISPALDAAKQYTAQVLDTLIREGRETEIRDTNWVSVTAAVHKCIRDFNGKQRFMQLQPVPTQAIQ